MPDQSKLNRFNLLQSQKGEFKTIPDSSVRFGDGDFLMAPAGEDENCLDTALQNLAYYKFGC